MRKKTHIKDVNQRPERVVIMEKPVSHVSIGSNTIDPSTLSVRLVESPGGPWWEKGGDINKSIRYHDN